LIEQTNPTTNALLGGEDEMPDFERLTDSLREHVASNPEQAAWARGFVAGKRKARIEVLVVLAVIYFVIALIGRTFGA
jgi:hypothetical protein